MVHVGYVNPVVKNYLVSLYIYIELKHESGLHDRSDSLISRQPTVKIPTISQVHYFHICL